MNERARHLLLHPRWLGIILIATLLAGGTAIWVGMQREPSHTATTYVFGRRVGFLNRPLPVLDEHLNDLVNAVEFPDVFASIEDRTLLSGENDYDFTIERSDDTQSVVEITVVARRAGDAERIARILAEEVVTFVLRGQSSALEQEITDIGVEIATIQQDQDRLRALSSGVSPIRARIRTEAQLAAIVSDDGGPVGTVEGQLLNKVTDLRPIADEYQRNIDAIGALRAQEAQFLAERSDITASRISVNEEWYRTITPVEPASNVPIAVAMGFAAAVPAALIATGLAYLNLRRRLRVDSESVGTPRKPSPAVA